MRKLYFVLLFIIVTTVSACGIKESPQTDTGAISGHLVSPTEKEPGEDEAEKSTGDSAKDFSPQEAENPVTPSDTVPQPSVKEPPTTQESKKPDKSEPPRPDEQEQAKPTPAYATAKDAKQISCLIAEYLNVYRSEQGTATAVSLTGLTKYAEYRSRQLISDFSHNTFDERAAATALSYGKYVEPSLYGMDGEPYYTACAGEAIAKAGYVGTTEHIAKSFAKLIRNSQAHWSYVGAADYKYIGVGITYESGMWYCDVALTREHYG